MNNRCYVVISFVLIHIARGIYAFICVLIKHLNDKHINTLKYKQTHTHAHSINESVVIIKQRGLAHIGTEMKNTLEIKLK